MEPKEKMDRIEVAIQQLMEEQKEMTSESDHHSLHLSNLISQQLEQPPNTNDGITEEDERRAIRKELKEIKRQNFITQCLVSALIVLTVTWQLSEVSLILKVRNGISHPFRSFGGMLKGVLKGPNLSITKNGNNNNKHDNSFDQHESGGTLVPPITIPELPHLGLNK